MIKQDRLFTGYLAFTAAICGAAVMVIEILGARVIGPFFGVSLFVWTSLITVTLIALATGYAAGGILADKKSSPDYLFAIVLLAGISVLLILFIKTAVLKTMAPMGLRLGSFLTAAILFGPPLFLLGLVTPYLVKIAAYEMRVIGKTVGLFYSISTIGSVIGAAMTGYYLIPTFGIGKIFFFTGSGLILLSVTYFVAHKNNWLALIFCVIPAFSTEGEPKRSVLLPNGVTAIVALEKEGLYGNVKVIDFAGISWRTRELFLNGISQGGIDLGNDLSIYQYSYLLELIPFGLNPDGKKGLMMGSGAGIVAGWYEKQGVTIDVVDIDPDVLSIANRFFDLKVTGDIIVSDARRYLMESDKLYDFIITDIFSGDVTPGHILSLEAIRLINKHLAPNGVFALNIIGDLDEEAMASGSVIMTVRKVFKKVDIHVTFDPNTKGAWGNIIVVAHNGSVARNEPIKDFTAHRWVKGSLYKSLTRSLDLPNSIPHIILTDDFNPIDFYNQRLKEKMRRHNLEKVGLDLLL